MMPDRTPIAPVKLITRPTMISLSAIAGFPVAAENPVPLTRSRTWSNRRSIERRSSGTVAGSAQPRRAGQVPERPHTGAPRRGLDGDGTDRAIVNVARDVPLREEPDWRPIIPAARLSKQPWLRTARHGTGNPSRKQDSRSRGGTPILPASKKGGNDGQYDASDHRDPSCDRSRWRLVRSGTLVLG